MTTCNLGHHRVYSISTSWRHIKLHYSYAKHRHVKLRVNAYIKKNIVWWTAYVLPTPRFDEICPGSQREARPTFA